MREEQCRSLQLRDLFVGQSLIEQLLDALQDGHVFRRVAPVAAALGAFSKEDVNGVATPIAPAAKFTVSTSPVMVRSH